jgi:hypothetical protein
MMGHHDSPEQQTARAEYAHQVRQRITLGASRQTYESRDMIKLEWQRDGEWHEAEIPVKSLTSDHNEKIQERNALDRIEFPKIPQIVETIIDAEGNEQRVLVNDNASTEAMEAAQLMTGWINQINYERLLDAIDVDLESPDGSRIVWSSENPDDYDRDEAIAALRALQIPERQLSQCITKINDLSVRAAQKETTDFLLGSEPQSERPGNSTSDGRNPSQTRRRRGQRR